MTNGLSELQIQQILFTMQGKRTAQPANSPTNSKANIVDTSPCLLPTLLSLYQLIIDSGATDHITPSSTLLVKSRKNIVLPSVIIPSEEQASITSIGNLPLNSAITLKNVLGAPFFKVDLMFNACEQSYQRFELLGNLFPLHFARLGDEDDD